MTRFALPLGLLTAAFAASGQVYLVSTIAGTGSSQGWSGDGGPALSAQFFDPTRVAVDKQGNVYVVDYYNYSVRKVNYNSGTVQTVAGNGALGYSGDGGSGLGAQCSSILDIAVDTDGTVYIADALNSRVRRVAPSGIITTYAGNGTAGYSGDGGSATAASVYYPAGLALDSAGNLYIADYGNATVRVVNKSTGRISTVAGVGYSVFGASPGDGGPATSAFLELPHSVQVDAAGNVYIGDIGSSSIRKVDTNGVINTYLTGIKAQSFTLDRAGNIYYADYTTNTIQKVLPGGVTRLWVAGNGTSGWAGDGGPATSAQFTLPYGVALDAAGNVYVADAGNSVIRELTPIAFSIGAIANAASLQGFAPPVAGQGDSATPLAPGEIVVLFGSGLGPATMATATPVNGQYPTTVGGTTVKIGGIAAPLLYASAGMVSAVVPFGIDGLNTVQVTVGYNGKTSRVGNYLVLPTAPGVFTADSSGAGQAKALNQDGSANSATNPAHVGDNVTLFITGAGQTIPAGVDGQIAGPTNLPTPVQAVNVNVNDLPAAVNSAAGIPGQVAGMTAVNFQIPTGLAGGAAVPVVVNVGGVNSPAVTIAIQ